MKTFMGWAETSVPVYSDGSPMCDSDCLYDNIRKYIVDECDEQGIVINSKEYDYEHFKDIQKDHPPTEWENFDW